MPYDHLLYHLRPVLTGTPADKVSGPQGERGSEYVTSSMYSQADLSKSMLACIHFMLFMIDVLCVCAWVRGCVGALVRGRVGAWVRGLRGCVGYVGCLRARVRVRPHVGPHVYGSTLSYCPCDLCFLGYTWGRLLLRAYALSVLYAALREPSYADLGHVSRAA